MECSRRNGTGLLYRRQIRYTDIRQLPGALARILRQVLVAG